MKVIALILSILTVVSASASAQDLDDAALDSLAAVFYTLDDHDEHKLFICNDIAAGSFNVDSTKMWAQRQIRLAKIQGNAPYEAKALGYMSWAHYYSDEFAAANECNFRALIIADSIGDDYIKAKNFLMLGDNFNYLCDYKQSQSYYSMALALYEKLDDKENIAACMRAMALNFFNQKMYKQSEEYYHKAIAIDSAANDADYLLADHIGLAWMYLTVYLHESSDPNIGYIYKAKREIQLGDSAKSDYEYHIYAALEAKSEVLFHEAVALGYKGQRLAALLDTMRQCHEGGYEIVSRLQTTDTTCFDICRANYYTLSRQYSKAKPLLDTLLAELDRGLVLDTDIPKLYLACDNYYKAINDYKTAYHYKSKFYESINSQSSVDYAVMATQEMAQSEFNKHLRRHKEYEARRARIVRYATAGTVALLLFFLYVTYSTRRHNRVLNDKNTLLQHQKSQIDASISYASLIQHAVMPDENAMKRLFADFYVVYRPLNIVAGDFYWATSEGGYKLLVCADSTGHGVPGAFVSMLGISLLNDLAPLAAANGGSASLILDEMRRRLMLALGQNHEKYQRGEKMSLDGIDLSLAVIDTKNSTLHFAGAYRPLWIFKDGAITELKPDKMPIGIYIGRQQDFTEKIVPIASGDILYMFSDGIPDQFGYTDSDQTAYHHFSVKRLRTTVLDIANRPFPDQQVYIESAIDSWQNGYQQLDDIIFLAVKI